MNNGFVYKVFINDKIKNNIIINIYKLNNIKLKWKRNNKIYKYK